MRKCPENNHFCTLDFLCLNKRCITYFMCSKTPTKIYVHKYGELSYGTNEDVYRRFVF
jgi:hypothetical protein